MRVRLQREELGAEAGDFGGREARGEEPVEALRGRVRHVVPATQCRFSSMLALCDGSLTHACGIRRVTLGGERGGGERAFADGAVHVDWVLRAGFLLAVAGSCFCFCLCLCLCVVWG